MSIDLDFDNMSRAFTDIGKAIFSLGADKLTIEQQVHLSRFSGKMIELREEMAELRKVLNGTS